MDYRMSDKDLADLWAQLVALSVDANPSTQSPVTLGDAIALVGEVIAHREWHSA